jgi:hypothetical protein
MGSFESAECRGSPNVAGRRALRPGPPRTILRSAHHEATCAEARPARPAPTAAAGRELPPRSLLTLAFLTSLTLFPPVASAQENGTPRLSFGAFGTLGLVYSTEHDADFVWNPTRPEGPGHSARVSPDSDSLLAGQATLRVTSKLTAVVQVVAEQTSEDDYTPEVEWANLRFDLTPELSVRAGRIALPAFRASEYRKVSYANPWVRPPVELYSLVPVSRLDGVETTYRLHVGDWTHTFDVSFGGSEADLPGDAGSVEGSDALTVSAAFQRGDLAGRAAAARGKLDIGAFDPLFDGFRAFGPEGRAIAERFEVDDTPFHFAAVGAEYDPGEWFALAEVSWFDSNSALGEKLAGYITGGYRRGAITSFVTYSRSELLSESSVPGLSLTGLPPPLVPVGAGLNAGLNGLLRGSPVQQNLAVGGRWDFTTGMALKLQVDFIDRLDDSPGTFTNQQPGFEAGGSAQLVSLATVFVF